MQISKTHFHKKGCALSLILKVRVLELEVSHRICSRRIYMKMEFSSQRREMLLFLITNMAAVASRALPTIREKLTKIIVNRGNGYETRQSSLLYVFVLFFGLDPAQNTIVVYSVLRN